MPFTDRPGFNASGETSARPASGESSFERLIAKVMSLPARHFFRSRRVSFLATGDSPGMPPRLVRGTYQSPILVQWKAAERRTRRITIKLVELY